MSTKQCMRPCHTQSSASAAVLPFSKLNKTFFGYFDPEKVILDNENNWYFRGELTDISAKKEALVCSTPGIRGIGLVQDLLGWDHEEIRTNLAQCT